MCVTTIIVLQVDVVNPVTKHFSFSTIFVNVLFLRTPLCVLCSPDHVTSRQDHVTNHVTDDVTVNPGKSGSPLKGILKQPVPLSQRDAFYRNGNAEKSSVNFSLSSLNMNGTSDYHTTDNAALSRKTPEKKGSREPVARNLFPFENDTTSKKSAIQDLSVPHPDIVEDDVVSDVPVSTPENHQVEAVAVAVVPPVVENGKQAEDGVSGLNVDAVPLLGE